MSIKNAIVQVGTQRPDGSKRKDRFVKEGYDPETGTGQKYTIPSKRGEPNEAQSYLLKAGADEVGGGLPRLDRFEFLGFAAKPKSALSREENDATKTKNQSNGSIKIDGIPDCSLNSGNPASVNDEVDGHSFSTKKSRKYPGLTHLYSEDPVNGITKNKELEVLIFLFENAIRDNGTKVALWNCFVSRWNPACDETESL